MGRRGRASSERAQVAFKFCTAQCLRWSCRWSRLYPRGSMQPARGHYFHEKVFLRTEKHREPLSGRLWNEFCGFVPITAPPKKCDHADADCETKGQRRQCLTQLTIHESRLLVYYSFSVGYNHRDLLGLLGQDVQENSGLRTLKKNNFRATAYRSANEGLKNRSLGQFTNPEIGPSHIPVLRRRTAVRR